MKSKTLSPKNGGEFRRMSEETLTENPSIISDVSRNQELDEAYTETEMEDVEGFTLLKPQDADKEVSSVAKTEAFETETGLEERGVDLPATETQPLDALFASYKELIPQLEMTPEVIIGPDNRARIFNTTIFPWRAICSLKITAQDGSRWIGTGWLVSPRTVITAGHCVFMHDHGGFARSIEVIPGLNDAARPYQSGVSSNLRSVVGWTQSKNRNYDYGAIILPSNYRPGDRTGYFGFAVRNDSYLSSAILNLSGYPGDKGGPGNWGNQQWFMALAAKSVSPRVIYYNIDTMGGQSGAPVWVKVGDARYCVGIHTNGASTGNSATRIVTPVFNNIQAWKALGV